jgi:hypothetical protein
MHAVLVLWCYNFFKRLQNSTFCESGIWVQMSWVILAQVSHEAVTSIDQGSKRRETPCLGSPLCLLVVFHVLPH